MTDEEIDEALKSGLFELGDPSRAELTCYLPEGKELPAVVKEKALKGGNAISYDGMYKGWEVYHVWNENPNGGSTPSGLPSFVLYQEGKVKVVCGLESFDIMKATE